MSDKTLTPKQNALIAAVVIAGGIGFVSYGYNQASESVMPVPTDSRAKYFVLERGGSAAIPTLTTRREGPSGTSFSSWEFDCARGYGRYLGNGDTLEQMKSSKPDPKMYEMVQGSISWYAMKEACGA